MGSTLLSLINITLFDEWNEDAEKQLARYNEIADSYYNELINTTTKNPIETLDRYSSVISDREKRRTEFLMQKALYIGIKIGVEIREEFEKTEDETE